VFHFSNRLKVDKIRWVQNFACKNNLILGFFITLPVINSQIEQRFKIFV